MNKKLVGCLIAASIVATTVIPGITAFADTATPANTQATQTTQSTPTKQVDGPVITTTYKHFLVLQGSDFNTAKDLGLKVTDPYDQDLASKIQVKPISTAKCLKYTMELNVTDTHGKSAEDTITINVIGIKPSIKLNSASDLSKADLLSLVEGNTQGLKATTSNVDAKAGTFTLNVTNGEETVSKTVKMDIAALPSIKPAVVTPQTDSKGNKVEALPLNQTNGTSTNTGSNVTTPVTNTQAKPNTTAANGSSSVSAEATPTSTQVKPAHHGLINTGSVAFDSFVAVAGLFSVGGVIYLLKTKFNI